MDRYAKPDRPETLMEWATRWKSTIPFARFGKEIQVSRLTARVPRFCFNLALETTDKRMYNILRGTCQRNLHKYDDYAQYKRVLFRKWENHDYRRVLPLRGYVRLFAAFLRVTK